MNNNTEKEAMVRMNGLADRLRTFGFTDKERETLLVRLLLCCFSEKTGAFFKSSFFDALFSEELSSFSPGGKLARIFSALAGERSEKDPDILSRFPVLSRLVFSDDICLDPLDEAFLREIVSCREVAWESLSPAIFGAMFQEIMNQDDRKEWGAYYTSEENIDRLIDPLFMEELLAERENCRGSRRKLTAFQDKLCSLTFLDPACGCGNFLVRIYMRLRLLELDVIRELYDTSQRILDISLYCHVSLSQFLGIEVEHFQAQTARICLWLAERQMDLAAAAEFGIRQVTPTMISPLGIREANALTTDWNDFVNRNRLCYIVGNPPFIGARRMNAGQKADMKMVFGNGARVGNMDYVTAWYKKAAVFMSGTRIRGAFVSTNSICQGEQAALLWKELIQTWHMQIDFAWKTFVWNNAVKGQAKVHCIIVGFSDSSQAGKGKKKRICRLYEQDRVREVSHINAYLTPCPDVFIEARLRPAKEVPEMCFGSMPNDGGGLILTAEERRDLLERYPETGGWIRPFIGAAEFIGGTPRYCLWLKEAEPEAWKEIPEIAERIQQVKTFRERSPRGATRIHAIHPHRFAEIRQPESGSMILVPRVSSMRRRYIPMGFAPSDWIASDAMLIIPGADEALFSVLTSSLHMIWVRAVAGRLKSDYRYSASVVYNNFPFRSLSGEDAECLRECGRGILACRSRLEEMTLAELYDPASMPEELLRLHQENDREVERVYGCLGRSEEELLTVLLTDAGLSV